MQHGQKQAINANRKQASEAEQEQQQRESPTSYKSEIRISKFETNSNFKFLNSKWTAPRQVHSIFGFRFCLYFIVLIFVPRPVLATAISAGGWLLRVVGRHALPRGPPRQPS